MNTRLLLKTNELAEIMNMSAPLARKILQKNGIEPIDLGPGRGKGLRWSTKQVTVLCTTLCTQAMESIKPCKKRKSKVPRPIFGRSPGELYAELNNNKSPVQ